MNKKITKYASDWLARGDDDLALVKLILENGSSSPNLACFHAQQAAEKYLKGFLTYHDLHVRKIHDLKTILEDCKNIASSFSEIRESVNFLNQFYSETRYPDDYIAFSMTDAKQGLEAAERIKEFVLKQINAVSPSSGFGTIVILIAVAALALLLGGGWYAKEYLNLNDNIYTPKACVAGQAPMCTRDIRTMCSPDGTKQRAVPSSCTCGGNDRRALVAEGWRDCTRQSLDTSTWKTYRNEKYGFEVKYPHDSAIKIEDGYKQSEMVLCTSSETCVKFLHIDWFPIQNGSYIEIPQKDSPPAFYFYWINTADSREIKEVISTVRFISP